MSAKGRRGAGRPGDGGAPPRRRRALTHVGGVVERRGDAGDAAPLAAALDVTPAPRAADEREQGRDHVHGFHAYTARMHPLTARRLLEAFSPVGGTVLDPFCGSGTVLIEARLSSRHAVGLDASPLAVRLATLRARGTTAPERRRLLEGAARVAEVATARRRERAGATRRYPPEDVRLFEPHVLLELDGLRAGLEQLGETATRRDLELVLSAILLKMSRHGGEPGEVGGPRRLAGGHATRTFQAKAAELAARLERFAALLPVPPPRLEVRLGDARRLELPAESVDLVLTSPPYAGTYDYLAQHEARLRWLGLDAGPLPGAEIGARRHAAAAGPVAATRRFASDLVAVLERAARALRPGGAIALLVADSVVQSRALFADELVRRIAKEAGLEVRAIASQERPHVHAGSARAYGRRRRREHAILLRRAAEGATPITSGLRPGTARG